MLSGQNAADFQAQVSPVNAASPFGIEAKFQGNGKLKPPSFLRGLTPNRIHCSPGAPSM